jgi:hypothetical protein
MEQLKCGVCGVSDVRLYRPGGSFYRPIDNRCNKHVSESGRGWYVPLIIVDGCVLGYGSIEPDQMKEFLKSSENDLTWWSWGRYGWIKDGKYESERYNNYAEQDSKSST